MIGQARKALQRIEMVRKSPLRRAFCRLEEKQSLYISNLPGSLAREWLGANGRPIFRPYEAWSKQYVPNIDVVFAANGGLVGKLDSSDSF